MQVPFVDPPQLLGHAPAASQLLFSVNLLFKSSSETGAYEGRIVGLSVGTAVQFAVGVNVGYAVGAKEGLNVGSRVGDNEGG
jgi:hypothetical protein